MKLTIDVPGGEDECEKCGIPKTRRPMALARFCGLYHEEISDGSSGKYKKCPACLSACHPYREAHDYDKAFDYLSEELGSDTAFYDMPERVNRILKALNINKEV